MTTAKNIAACRDQVNGFVWEVDLLAKEHGIDDYVVGCYVKNGEEVKPDTMPCVRGATWRGSDTEAAIMTGILLGRLKDAAVNSAIRKSAEDVERHVGAGREQADRTEDIPAQESTQ